MKILCHNCYWLQGHPFETDRPGAPVAEIASALVELYRRAGAGLLCLQEVQDEAAFGFLRDALAMEGAFTPGGGFVQYGGASFWSEGSARGGRPVADSVSAGADVQRMWQLVEVASGETPVVVAHLHLPSARQLGPGGAAAARVSELAAGIDLRTPEPDVVLGDFNEQPGGPVGELLAGRGYLDAAVLADLPARPTGVRGGRGDQIWIRKDLRGELVEYALVDREHFAAEAAGKEYLSDHLPLWVTLDAGRALRETS